MRTILKEIKTSYQKTSKARVAQLVLLALLFSSIIGSSLYYLTRNYVIQQAEKKVQDLLMRRQALHLYLQRDSHPALYRSKKEGQIKEDFYSPVLFFSSYMARKIHIYYNQERAKAGLPELYYKFAAINPRNPVNKGSDFETKLIEMFNKNKEIKEYRKITEINGKKYLYYARPFIITNDACLKCHGLPEAAPEQLVKIYGREDGFHAEPGKIRAIESIRAPLVSELKSANIIFISLLSGGLFITSLMFVSYWLQTKVKARTRDLKAEIDKRKKIQESLAEANIRFSEVLDTVDSVIYVTDMNTGEILFINRHGQEQFGDVTGKTCWEVLQSGQTGPCDFCTNSRLLTPEAKPAGVINWVFQNTKNKKWFDCRDYAIPWADGRTVRLEIATDITEKIKTEEEKKKLEAQVQRSEKMETIGTLAGGVAHDLNNILGAIVGYPDLLLEDLPEDSPLRKEVNAIKESGEKAATIVQDLLTLARRSVKISEVVNLNTIIARQMDSREFSKLKEFHPGVSIQTDLVPNLLNIIGSPVHLSKTITNLVSNAMEAISGKGEVKISTRNIYLDRPVHGYDKVEEGDYAVVTVEDNGTGISDTDLKRIFEPFYTKKIMGRSGTGLGMAVVWGTMKDHKGYIDVESTENRGTTFSLYFPVTRKETATAEKLLSLEDYTGKGEKILVVDDIFSQREIASSLLKKLGYTVETVKSGEEAVEYMKNNSADLLVLDMIMDPGMDGLETYKQILNLKKDQKTIIASGFSETDRVKEALRLGAALYIKKPYTIKKIGIAIKKALTEKNS